jgi:hypothetical protein
LFVWTSFARTWIWLTGHFPRMILVKSSTEACHPWSLAFQGAGALTQIRIVSGILIKKTGPLHEVV